MDFTIIGLGYVGLVNAVYLASLGHKVIGYDIDKNKISLLKQGVATLDEPNLQEMLNEAHDNIRFTSNAKDAIRPAKIIFICVDTPQDKDGSVNLKNYYSVLDSIIANAIENQTIVIRSTVPVGTNKLTKKYLENKSEHKFIVISFPEFLSQGKAMENLVHPYRLIIGVNGAHALSMAKQIGQAFLIKKATVMITTPENAEMIKYASNCFLALKISYINDIAKLCEHVGADVTKVAKGMSLDPRIGSSFFNAGIGYGGSCFPKDTNGLYWISNNNHEPLELVNATIRINESMVDFFLDKINRRFRSLNNLRIAVLGVAFKGGTEDIRNSRAIPVVKSLLEKGAKVTIYDPLAMDNFAKLFSRHSGIKFADYAEDALKGSDCAVILNDSSEFLSLSANDYISLMRRAIIFDGRNLYKVEDMEGTEYYSIGRPSNVKTKKND